MSSKVAVTTTVKLPVKNKPHTINAADNAAVTQNTDPVPDNMFCTLCIRKPSLPKRSTWAFAQAQKAMRNMLVFRVFYCK